MADIFLSYARTDRAIAEQVKAGLESAGLSVFFDVDGLDGGDVFPDVLDREVKTAGAVVSLWSQHSLSRPWVKQECSIGLKRRCLIPVAIEPLGELDVPVAFEGLQQIDFTGFHGRVDTPEWQKLMRSLSRTLGRPELVAGLGKPAAPARKAVQMAGDTPNPERRTRSLWIIFGVLGAALVAGIGARNYLSNNEIAKLEDPAPAAMVDAEAAAADFARSPAAPEPAGVAVLEPDFECSAVRARIYFDFDRTGLNMEALSVLEEAMTRSFDCEITAVRIEAHEDLNQSAAYAQGVSERRAQAVAQWLIENGVAAGSILTMGFGSERPLETGQRSPANRRADVLFEMAPTANLP